MYDLERKKMNESKVLEKLRKGLPVFCQKSIYAEPDIVEMMGLLGVDVVWICNEHLGIDPSNLKNVIRSGRVGGADIMVRKAFTNYDDLIQLLEMGANGLMIPHCKNAEMVSEIVKHTKFFPVGERGIDGVSADSGFGTVPLVEYMNRSNENTFVMVQIEDKEAIDHIEEMAAVDGVDIIFIGPADLSQSLGIPGDIKNKAITDVIKRTVDACNKNGKWCGTSGIDFEYINELLHLGVRFITYGSDYGLLKKGFSEIVEKCKNVEF
jgi:4-hydroxy-2-oxoheptanedioate aldolase